MRFSVFVMACFLVCANGQTPAGAKKTVATVNGKAITASDFEQMISSYPAAVKQAAVGNPEEFLRRHAFFLRALEGARATGLDQKQPYKFQLESILFNAYIESLKAGIVIQPEDQLKYYKEHSADFKDRPFDSVRDDIYKNLFDAEHRKKIEAASRAEVKVVEPSFFKK